jgi:hypothetical protein
MNSESVGDTSSNDSPIVVIIDEDDVNAPANDTISEFKGINMITGIYAGTHAIVPAALLSNNFDITYGLGTLTILPAELTVKADNKSGVYGDNINYTSTVSGLQYDDNLAGISSGSINYALSQNGNPIAMPAPAGNFTITPSGLNLNQPADYTVHYESGSLSLSKATLQAKADNKTRIYGDANPTFTVSYSGFLNNDGPASITAPTASTTAIPSSNVGTYPITLSGGSSNNYNINLVNGTLTVSKADLVVTADTKFIFKGASNPAFTSTITGWKNNEQTTITSGPTYSVPTNCNQSAGAYTISVCCLNFPKKANYNISYVSGTLYINPKGTGAKKIELYLTCIDTLIGSSTGLPYLAKFQYENPNSTPIYIPVGTSNMLSGAGVYVGTPPVVFNPGYGTFNVPFNGTALTWTVKSYYGSTLTTVTKTASSTSPKCYTSTARTIEGSIGELISTVAPNPTSGELHLSVSGITLQPEVVAVYDLLGKACLLPITQDGDGLTINCSTLTQGLYILQLNHPDYQENIRFIKE